MSWKQRKCEANQWDLQTWGYVGLTTEAKTRQPGSRSSWEALLEILSEHFAPLPAQKPSWLCKVMPLSLQRSVCSLLKLKWACLLTADLQLHFTRHALGAEDRPPTDKLGHLQAVTSQSYQKSLFRTGTEWLRRVIIPIFYKQEHHQECYEKL